MDTLPDVVILGKDKDFTETLAAQIRQELGLGCRIAENKDILKQMVAGAMLVVASEAVSEKDCGAPVITVENRPVKLQDLLDRIDAIRHNHSVDEIELGAGVTLLIRQKQLALGGKSVTLTDKEAQLLQSLAGARGKVVTKEQLLKQVWGFDETLDTHTLETHIYRLRGKMRELTDDDTCIAANEGGYALVMT